MLKRKTAMRPKSTSDTALTKERIQALLRQIVIKRDGGCLLRNSPETTACGGWRKDGQLILQAEHLHTRSNSASYSDSRLVICLCKNHHIFYKPRHSNEYYETVKRLIGPTRTALLLMVEENRYKATKVDWKLEELALQQELKRM